ncbi:hypothetical protein [Micromonospora auratinigra]|uniref:Uncharacterized protein n=1 Tax=Micromonospora auratinigra TaxID=261654 RepID=A0A1A9A9X2_9ACTN|nr:hypothetical protein [Micromonospora auratinigra]SBT52972.1 hypothetical protein GA0070611_5888 [Micromonospora auratinigra]
MAVTNRRAAAKACILAAIPVGAVGFVVPDTWAKASIVASLTLLALGGDLWWDSRPIFPYRFLRARAQPHRTADPVRHHDGSFGGVPAAAERREPRRYRLMVSATSRIRQVVRQRQMMSLMPADGDGDASDLRQVLDEAQRRGRREQFWWLVAGLAASIPIGVAVNLLTR